MNATFGSARALTHREHGWLIALLALVLAPLLRGLPLVTCSVFGVLLLWRTWLWVRRAPLPNKWLLGVASVAVLGITLALALRTGGNIGRDLAVAVLGAFLVLKLMESHTARNGILVTQLCCFLLLSQTLFDQPPWMAATLLASVALLLYHWMLLLHPQARTRLSVARALLRLVVTGLPCAAVLFLLFPRLDHPLWRLPQGADVATSGLTDRMAPGSIGQLILSDDLAFRADFNGAPPPPHSSSTTSRSNRPASAGSSRWIAASPLTRGTVSGAASTRSSWCSRWTSASATTRVHACRARATMHRCSTG